MTPPSASQLARVAATAAAAVDGVVALDAGPLGTRSTYGPDGKVDGVTVRAGQPTVHIAVRFGLRIPELAQTVAAEVDKDLGAAFPTGEPWETEVNVVDVSAPDGEAHPPGPRPELQ